MAYEIVRFSEQPVQFSGCKNEYHGIETKQIVTQQLTLPTKETVTTFCTVLYSNVQNSVSYAADR